MDFANGIMYHIAIAIEYDGSHFVGWQKQSRDDCRTVQNEIEKAIVALVKIPIGVVCAGRTDKGVHAFAQVANFSVPKKLPLSAWSKGLNSVLPNDINICWAAYVDISFSARYSAIAREYHYLILNRSYHSALLRDRCYWYRFPLAMDEMKKAARYLLGKHDFSSFRSSECQSKTAIRSLYFIKIEKHNEMIKIRIKGNAFLHHMVRNIVGTLLEVANGKQSAIWVEQVLLAKDRRLAGPTAPAEGLYFKNVMYPEGVFTQISD